MNRQLSCILSITIILFSGGTAFAQEFPKYNIKVESVAENLQIPWEIAFAPDGRIFFTERTGSLRVIEHGRLLEEPALKLDVADSEGGLLGLALDPNFTKNHHIYLYYTYSDFLSKYNRVSRFNEANNNLSDETILIDKIPASPIHDGGRIRFGPDGKLYITTGDSSNGQLAQDLNSLAGKILRINPDGSIPVDNPFENSPVYSYGHRNPQGIDWDPTTGILVESEHGPSGEKGFAHDEINIIRPGANYGWPEVVGEQTDPKYESPLYQTGTATWAPSGSSFYNSDKIPFLKGKFLVATLRGEHLHAFDVDTKQKKILTDEPLFEGLFGRLRDVVEHDGFIYLLTSNKDGRGMPAPNDDRILKIIPLQRYNPPLQQLKDGTRPQEIMCNDGYLLAFKKEDGTPACVRPATINKLIERGWTTDSLVSKN